MDSYPDSSRLALAETEADILRRMEELARLSFEGHALNEERIAALAKQVDSLRKRVLALEK